MSLACISFNQPNLKRATLLLALLINLIYAYNQLDTSNNHYSIAADISPYAFNGFSIKGSAALKKYPRLELHAEVFSMEYPEFFLKLNNQNVNASNIVDMKTKVQLGIASYIDYKLTKTRSSWYTGIGIVNLDERAEGISTKWLAEYSLTEVLLRIHYKKFIKHSNFFINPYLAVGNRWVRNGSTAQYALVKNIALASVYFGYEF